MIFVKIFLLAAITMISFNENFSLMAQVTEADGVAKIIVLRGDVRAKDKAGQTFVVEKDMWLAEGTVLQSAEKSFCRLLFIDRSTMNLGPDSQMMIDEFPKDKAGIITLMKGQVRSNVTKDYMNISEKDQSKLFIKTKTAAMGVRGTDFQVNYNPRNENTALITFSGVVAMAQLDGTRALDHVRLEAAVSGDRAVQVRQGEFSGVTPTTTRATIPTKMNPVQLESLKQNQTGIIAPTKTEAGNENAQYRNPVPPGVNSKSFANDPRASATASVGSALGQELTQAMPAPAATDRVLPPAEGFFNAATGEYAPPAGSVIDLATVNIIPPPKGSAFDPISGTFNLPPEMGAVNPKTGSYDAPAGLKLNDAGVFVSATAPTSDGRTPASAQTAATVKAPVISSPLTQTVARTPDSTADRSAQVSMDQQISNLIQETQLKVERETQNAIEQTVIQTTTNATFRFNVRD